MDDLEWFNVGFLSLSPRIYAKIIENFQKTCKVWDEGKMFQIEIVDDQILLSQ